MRFKTLILVACLAMSPFALASDDPWRWLENIDDKKSLDWVRANNESTAKRLKSNPLFEELYEQARTVLNGASR